MTGTDAAAYVAWLRREPIFRDRLHDIRKALDGHDDASGARLLASVHLVSSVLPPSARGLRTLLLDEGEDIVVGPSESLADREWERLTTTARMRLRRGGPMLASDDVGGTEARFLESALLKIDPASPVLVPKALIGSATSRSQGVAA